jgi:hypothetical protein
MSRDRATPEQAGSQTLSITGFVIVAVVAVGSFLMLLLAAAAPQGHDARTITQVTCGIDEPSGGAHWKLSWTCLASSPSQPLQ